MVFLESLMASGIVARSPSGCRRLRYHLFRCHCHTYIGGGKGGRIICRLHRRLSAFIFSPTSSFVFGRTSRTINSACFAMALSLIVTSDHILQHPFPEGALLFGAFSAYRLAMTPSDHGRQNHGFCPDPQVPKLFLQYHSHPTQGWP